MAQKIPLSVWVFKTFFITILLVTFFAALSGCAGPQTRPSYQDGSVRFSIDAPETAEVSLVLFQKENAPSILKEYLTVKKQDGLRVAMVQLAPGEYHYFFRIDGKVAVDPKAPRQEIDDFGGGNSLLTLERSDDGSMKIY